MKKILSKKGGFTLIELLVVIAIIAILTAIVTSNFAQSKAKARDSKRISDIAQIQLALALFFDRCNAYPTDITTDATAASCPLDSVTNSPITFGYFISKVPTPPVAGSRVETKYDYEVVGSDYLLMANLELKSSVLNDDIDGSDMTPFSGFSCEDDGAGVSGAEKNHYYCVKPN